MNDETLIKAGKTEAVQVQAKQASAEQSENATEATPRASETSKPATDVGVSAEQQNSNPNMRWFVVQAFSGFEKRVKNSLQDYITRAEKQDSFGRILVPTEEVVEMKAGQKRTSERKFFPGYVLVEMEMTDETWYLVKSVPKVAGFIGGTENRPMSITQQEAEEIIQQISDSADKPKMKFTFAPGEIVRIIDGPFQDFNGTVEDTNFEKAKLKVSVTIFGRSTPVELDFTQVEKG